MGLTQADLIQPQYPYYGVFRKGVRGTVTHWSSSWRTGGNPSIIPAIPPFEGEVYDKTHAAALPLPALSVGENLYVTQADLQTTVPCSVMVVDRLVANGGLSGVVTTEQAGPSEPLPARAGAGEGVLGFVECYVSTGATARDLVVTYTNSDGVSGRVSTIKWPASIRPAACAMIPLIHGDKGIRSVESIQFSGTTGIAGNIGVTLVKPVFYLGSNAVGVQERSGPIALMTPVVDKDACLQTMDYTNGGSSVPFTIALYFHTKNAV